MDAQKSEAFASHDHAAKCLQDAAAGRVNLNEFGRWFALIAAGEKGEGRAFVSWPPYPGKM